MQTWVRRVGWLVQELIKCSWTVKSERKLQSCLKLRKSQNPFCHILEITNRDYENKNCQKRDKLTVCSAFLLRAMCDSLNKQIDINLNIADKKTIVFVSRSAQL